MERREVPQMPGVVLRVIDALQRPGRCVRWADVILLTVAWESTGTGEKWLCLTLDAPPKWQHVYRPGGLVHFRDMDLQDLMTEL